MDNWKSNIIKMYNDLERNKMSDDWKDEPKNAEDIIDNKGYEFIDKVLGKATDEVIDEKIDEKRETILNTIFPMEMCFDVERFRARRNDKKSK